MRGFFRALVETKKSPYVWSFAPALREGGFIYINADVRKENSIDSAEMIMLETLDGLNTNPPTEDEMQRANWSATQRSKAAAACKYCFEIDIFACVPRRQGLSLRYSERK